MFTAEEEPLLSGSDSDLQDFIDPERCMVVDWRSNEEEILEDAQRWLPPETLKYGWLDEERYQLKLCFLGREIVVPLKHATGDNWRVLLRLTRILRPEYELLMFQCTDGSDTPCFLLRPREWWQAYCDHYPGRFDCTFTTMEERSHLWGLSRSEMADDNEKEPWWKVW